MYSLTNIAQANNSIICEVLKEKGFSGAIEIIKGSLTKGLLEKLSRQ